MKLIIECRHFSQAYLVQWWGYKGDSRKNTDSDKLYTGDELSINRDRLLALTSEDQILDTDSLTSDSSEAEVFLDPNSLTSTYKSPRH